MASEQYGMQHCDATVADYEKIASKCPCMKCFGTGCNDCKVWQDAKNRLICGTCAFRRGR